MYNHQYRFFWLVYVRSEELMSRGDACGVDRAQKKSKNISGPYIEIN